MLSRERKGSVVTVTAAVALVVLTSLAGEASAFGGLPHRTARTTVSSSSSSSSALFGNSENIRAAMEATERHGIRSPEARLAWEVVEEFDASTNDSAAYEPDPNRPGLSPEELSEAYRDVGRSMELMRSARTTASPVVFRDDNNRKLLLDVAAELRAIRLSPPAERPAPKIPGLWDSKLKARAVTQQFGVGSPEAKLAWEEVEEIAASGLERAVTGNGGDGNGGETDLVQAAQACEALEELDRFLYHENYPAGDAPDEKNNDDNGNTVYDNGDPYNYGYNLDAPVDNSMAGYAEGYNQAYHQNDNNNDENYGNENYGYNGNDYNNNGGGGGTYH